MRVKQVLICLLLAIIVFTSVCPSGLADDWVKARPGERTWVDTSHYEWLWRWIDTSHWELWWGWFWISSGYWTYYWDWYEDGWAWFDSGWMSVPYVGYYGWPYREDRGSVVFYWWVDYYWRSYKYRGRWYRYLVADWAAGEIWKVWYRVWYWVDTSHWEWRPYWAWVSSGYWEQYLAWITSGYWAEPLHGTVTISKSPSYIFTKWHYLTADGRKHGDADERAHIDLTISWVTDRPIASVQEYADVKRHDKAVSTERIDIATSSLETPSLNGTLESRAEYQHAGIATHYFVLKAQDGSIAIVYCDIPINGFTGININRVNTVLPVDQFPRSLQDVGTATF